MYYYKIANRDNKFLGVICSENGIMACTVPVTDKKQIEKWLNSMSLKISKLGKEIKESDLVEKYSDLIFNLDTNLKKYWNDALKVDIDFSLYTNDQAMVAKSLRETKPGDVLSYSQLAEKSGFSKGARFVGNCMANNYLPLLIPCHRVIKANMDLGNYSAGGKKQKYRYLTNEGSINKIKLKEKF